jgi:hypothetical protein
MIFRDHGRCFQGKCNSDLELALRCEIYIESPSDLVIRSAITKAEKLLISSSFTKADGEPNFVAILDEAIVRVEEKVVAFGR